MSNPGQTKSSEKRRKYIELRCEGAEPAQAARLAGFKGTDASTRLEKHTEVVAALSEVRSKVIAKGIVSHEENVKRLIDAFDLAKQERSAGDMVRAVNEMNRMLGFHAPAKVTGEVDHKHKHDHAIEDKTQDFMRSLQTMSTEKLLEHVGGEDGVVIEGEIVDDGRN